MKPKKLEVTNFLGLKNLSLEFPEQGVFVITGPNGSGNHPFWKPCILRFMVRQ